MDRLIIKYHLILTALLTALIVSIAPQSTTAQDVADKSQQTLLIIDSYYENDPWSNSIIIPIAKTLANHDYVHCEIAHLNNCLLTDSASYAQTEDRIFNKYQDNAPEYLVMIGNTAFNMRDRIKEQWGDIPILLIGRNSDYGPLDYYFSHLDTTPLLSHPLEKIRTLRDDYNFTMIIVPDEYRQTIDMMMAMIDNMDELIFFADPLYHNRNLSYNISNYIAANYPTVKYRWVVGSEQNAEVLREYIIHKHPNKGLLLSTWFYTPEDASILNAPTVGDLNLLSSSVNPFFALRQSYIQLGAVGGVYSKYDPMIEHTLEVIDQMLDGASMHDIPFYADTEPVTLINYPSLATYGIPVDRCPAHSVFIDKPPTFWKKHSWAIAIIAALVLLVAYVSIRRSITVRRQAETLRKQISFVNSMPIPFSKADITQDKKGDIKDVTYSIMNDAFRALINDNKVPDSTYQLFPATFIAEKVHQLLSTGQMVMFTHHFSATDTYYEFIINKATGLSKQTQRLGQKEVDIFAVDITHRYKMEADLKRTTEKLNITLNVAGMKAWELDIKSGTISLEEKPNASESATKGSGESLSIDLDEFISRAHPDDLPLIADARTSLLSGAIKDFTLQLRIRRSLDREEYDWVELHGIVTDYYIDASPKTVTGSYLNITGRKQQEQEMALTIKRANESDMLKSAFLANMSHEIRTPLNAIIGFSSLLTETDDPVKKREFSDIINRNNDLLLNIVNDVLDLAKIESNSIDINYSVTDLNDLMTNVRETVRLRLQNGVMLNTVLGADSCVVVLDSNRVQQILFNLLSNACKFTHQGNISFGYEINDDHLYFFVKDTGIGMSPEQLESVFQRFYKADNFTQGTGLGLSICKSLVEKMQGEIGVQSRGQGKGSTFWFTLPYRIATPDMESEQDFLNDNFDLKGIKAGTQTQKSMPTILVAEDNDSNYRLIEHLLANRFRLIHANNGIEAIDMFLAESPDLIIMDINMPQVDGYAAVAEIRKLTLAVPIIGVTAYAYASDRKRILSSGFNDYVAKPINPKLLYDAIDKYLRPRT